MQVVVTVSVLIAATTVAPLEDGVAMRRAADPMHGRVVLDNFSSAMGAPAVTFDHWRHRALYTCRVCHVDLAFALEAGETRISATTNGEGLHCGACHDGKAKQGGKAIFRACSGWPKPDAARGCLRCHTGADAGPGRGYDEFKAKLPQDDLEYIDWEAAERRGLIKPSDTLPGVSVKRPTMRIDRDVTLASTGTWLQNVTFSHKKHSVRNGCELCHPDVFPVMQRGSVKYDMAAIRAGQYCGVCHDTVAFPFEPCKRCHADQQRSRQPFR